MSEPVTAILPMKGYSDRLEKKNLKMVCGYPLCWFIMQTLIQCKASYINRVLVTTDDEELAEFSEAVLCGFKDTRIVMRPDSLAGKSMNDVIMHAIREVDGSFFLQVHATSPFVSKSTLEGAAKQLMDGRCRSIVGVSAFQKRVWDGDKPLNHDPLALEDTQDLKTLTFENSAFYGFTREFMEDLAVRCDRTSQKVPLEWPEDLDVDNYVDYDQVRMVAETWPGWTFDEKHAERLVVTFRRLLASSRGQRHGDGSQEAVEE